jgi:predicted NBD/HSP70 family sugar kinase
MRRLDFTNTQVASSETARDINRGVVLNLIRRRQPISRADLARMSGLQRSTVSLITEQLIREDWVVYGATGRLPRGRRPTFLRLNERRAIVVADLRPVRSTIAVADVNGEFLSQDSMPTPADPRAAIKSLVTRIRQQLSLHPGRSFEGIGISLSGRFDFSRQQVVFAPNLKWPGVDLKTPLQDATGMRVEIENAANACVLAEVWFGNAGEKAADFVVLTVAEGVGMGVFCNGQLVRGANSMAGEFGHVSLDPEGPPCACGRRGCWEVFASNRAALRYYQESGPVPEGFTFQDLLALAESGDSRALAALERMAHGIGRGLRTIVAGLSPEEIVVAAELTRMWHFMGPVIETELASAVLAGKAPMVRPAVVEPRMARLRGAVALVLQKHFGPAGKESSHGEPELVTRPLARAQ